MNNDYPNIPRLVVLGAGESGTGAAILAKQKGFDVFVSDCSHINPIYKALLEQHRIAWEEGQHTESSILNATEVVKSPASLHPRRSYRHSPDGTSPFSPR